MHIVSKGNGIANMSYVVHLQMDLTYLIYTLLVILISLPANKTDNIQ